MNRFISLGLGLSLASMALATRATDDSGRLHCSKSARFLAPIDSPDARKYAPDRDVQFLHLAIDVTPDFQQRTIQSKVSLRFKPNLKPVRNLKLDAVDLDIAGVEATVKVQDYQVTAEQLVVTFAEPVAADQEVTMTISYSAEPQKGLYFRTPEMGYKPGDTHLFTQGEAIEARHWYPCPDSPDIKFTSEVTCHIPDGMVAVSNGRLVGQIKDPATGLVAVHWSQEKPHANYLVTLVAGYLKKLEDSADGIPLAFYTPASEIQYASSSFASTRDIMTFFNHEIGVRYPWPKYDQLCVNDFVEGGMENTSATTLTDHTLFTDATENIRDSDGLVAHEMAHQWFGDLVTCKDWSHVWLNEGFATYYESLYAEHKHGRNALLYELYGRTRQITSISNDVNAIVRRTYDSPDDMFSYLAYPKASWVLHALRSQLGAQLYRRAIKTYLERHAYGSVVTEDLRRVIEELTGRSYDRFFDQWLYHAHHPELEVSYAWDELSKQAKLSIRQVQKLGENVLLFDLPTAVRFKGKFGTVDRPVHITAKEEDFYFPLESAPETVRLDPEYTFLARISFSLPAPMLYAQLADPGDVIGRLLAIEQLAGRRNKESVTRLKQTLNGDSFYGVRIEAARALRSIHSDDAFEALLASTKQADARVRLEVMDDLGGFYREKAYEVTRAALETEKNPAIAATEIRDLAGYSKPELRQVFVKFLHSQSFENQLADAAVSAIRSEDDPSFLPELLDALEKHESEFTTGGFAQGVRALGYIARNEQNKQQVRQLLASYLHHKKRTIQLAAIAALAALGDPAAIAPLQKIATAHKNSSERTAAERAIAELRAARKPVDDFKNLRQEVLDLQKSNRELRRELEELQKKLESRSPSSSATAKSKRKPATLPPKHGF